MPTDFKIEHEPDFLQQEKFINVKWGQDEVPKNIPPYLIDFDKLLEAMKND